MKPSIYDVSNQISEKSAALCSNLKKNTAAAYHATRKTVAIAAIISFGATGAVVAQDDTVEINTLNYWIGAGVGGGYDRYGRLLAEFMERQLGDANVIPEIRSAVGGLDALRELSELDADDATVMLFNTGLILDEMAGNEDIDFNLADFNWIGKASSEARFVIVSADSGFETFQDLRDAEAGVIFTTGSFGNSGHIQTGLLNNAFDLELKIVPGFRGSESLAALLKGESQGELMSEGSAIRAVEAGSGIPILVFGDPVSPLLQDTPKATDIAQTGDEILATDLITALSALGRITVASPHMDPALVAKLRAAYAAAIADPELLERAAQQGMPIDYLSGEEAGQLARDILNGDPRIRELVVEVIEQN
ncbi:Tripartite-type tricarboxylate transporter, receptor component TctC [Yoonia tamlensis]|uniref:Tripartite-type tricarboxylate transporter, receptor component TctC n=1 Tax=Yoonia tamlensis TaxID=390270 RepID=A0A1I6GZH4_9RHOB|nr:tripartite tricarboxylate transporter substrate-binding protein [Yoonia tamlensis]SFR47615.1 Tripartite-type tricarboxylate transporter, receptor component TctC [Yoonia tamlensis]